MTLLFLRSPSPDVSRFDVARPCRRPCHRATAGGWTRGVPVRYVAGTDTRGRQEGRPYPWSKQVIHKISGLSKRDGKSEWRSSKCGLELNRARKYILHFNEDNVNSKKSSFGGGSIKLKIQTESIKSVIPKSGVGGCPESRNKDRLVDTPSTSLRVVSLSNHGSRLRLVRYDV